MSNSPKVERKLAAIMFTDIVGYTQQMSEDEDKAFALIKKKRDLLLPLIEKHEGKLIKEIGDDGLLIARKHISWTCKDFKGASNLRNNLVRAVDKNEVKNLINKMIKTLNNEKNTLA